MTLPLFVASLDAVEQILATERASLVSDMTAVVSAIYAKKGTNPLGKHMDRLSKVARGGFSGDAEK